MSAASFVPELPSIRSLKVRALLKEIIERDLALTLCDTALFHNGNPLGWMDEGINTIEDSGFIAYACEQMQAKGQMLMLIYARADDTKGRGCFAINKATGRRYGASTMAKAVARMYLAFLRTQAQ